MRYTFGYVLFQLPRLDPMVPEAMAAPEEFSTWYCAPVAVPLASRNASLAPLAAYPTWLTRTEPAVAADAPGGHIRAAATAATAGMATAMAMVFTIRPRPSGIPRARPARTVSVPGGRDRGLPVAGPPGVRLRIAVWCSVCAGPGRPAVLRSGHAPESGGQRRAGAHRTAGRKRSHRLEHHRPVPCRPVPVPGPPTPRRPGGLNRAVVVVAAGAGHAGPRHPGHQPARRAAQVGRPDVDTQVGGPRIRAAGLGPGVRTRARGLGRGRRGRARATRCLARAPHLAWCRR